uniref:Uncharacterized protein n=1 Tax=Trichuris muris TaxID=70415 RepID=A0A5S6Q743_TRIMR
MTRRCFQLRCTDVLTINNIIETIKSSWMEWQDYAQWLNFSDLYMFFNHLPCNFRLINSGPNGRDVQVQYLPLEKNVVCSHNKHVALNQQPVQQRIVPRTQRMNKQVPTSTASAKAQVDCCAFLMFAFLELGRCDVSLLSLTKFLADADLPDYIKAVLRGVPELCEFMAMRPYLFFQINETHFRMFDLSTAGFIVELNNFIWKNGNRIPIESLPSIAENLEEKMENTNELITFMENNSSLFSIKNGLVSAKAPVRGFKRACELLSRL